MSSPRKGATRGTVYREVARLRLQDSQALLDAGRFLGAAYLAGYAIECLLKYGVTRRKEAVHLPADLEVHDLDRLLGEAGLQPALRQEPSVEAVFSGFADGWGPALRYRTRAISLGEASRLYAEAEQLYLWIDENLVT